MFTYTEARLFKMDKFQKKVEKYGYKLRSKWDLVAHPLIGIKLFARLTYTYGLKDFESRKVVLFKQSILLVRKHSVIILLYIGLLYINPEAYSLVTDHYQQL